MALGGEHNYAAWERTREQARQQQAHQVEVGQVVHLHQEWTKLSIYGPLIYYGPVCNALDAGKYIYEGK